MRRTWLQSRLDALLKPIIGKIYDTNVPFFTRNDKKAVQLETLINERRALLGKDRVWLSSKLKPLMRVTTDHVQLSLLEHEDMCESGYCFV